MVEHTPNDSSQPTGASEAEWLQGQIAAFEARLSQLTSARSTMPPPRRPVDRPTAPTARPASAQPGAPDRHVSVAPPPPWASGSTPTRRPEITLPGFEPLLKWSGLVLMFLSALFLVSTAIQRGWIGPEMQLAGAAAIGAALIAGGLVLGQRRSGWDVPLVGVGIAVLSATATAGWAWLELWSYEPWVVASFAVLALGVALTERLRGPGVAATALVASAISIGMLSTSVAEAAMLLALVVLIGEATSIWRRLAALHLITASIGLVSFAIVAAVASLGDGPTSLAVLVSGAIVTLAIWFAPLALAMRGTMPSPLGINWRPTITRLVISLPTLFAVAWAWSAGLTDDQLGWRLLFVGLAALISAVAVAATNRFARAIWVSQLMGGAVAGAIGSAQLLDGPALLIGLALQAAALLVFVHLVTDRWATIQAGFMATIAALLTLAGMLAAIESNAPVVDDLAHLGVIAMLAGWAVWELRSDQRLGLSLAGATFAGLVIWPVSALIHVPQGQALISATWAVLGFAALVAAFARSSVRLARLSSVTLAVVTVKLLTVDLAAVDTFWRVGLFFVLGGSFLVASFRVGTAVRALADTRDQDQVDQGSTNQTSGFAFQK